MYNEINEFHLRTRDVSDPHCYFFHPEYAITLQDAETCFDVAGISIDSENEFYIYYEQGIKIFNFLPRKYFEIIDFRIPLAWWIGGFPKWWLSFEADWDIIEYDKPIISSEKLYYWGYPFFFSEVGFLYSFYCCREKYMSIIELYFGFNEDRYLKDSSKEEIEAVIASIRSLP